jgi:hypothetical protein
MSIYPHGFQECDCGARFSGIGNQCADCFEEPLTESCPACNHPILPGDMTEPAFLLERGECRVHWDCAHGDSTEQDATDYSEYNADKGVRGVARSPLINDEWEGAA